MIRVGVIGLRRGESLVRTCNAVGGAAVTAIYDPDTQRLLRGAEAYGATPYTEFDAFLASGIDLVVVASPIPYHAEQSAAALRAGKHVLCEVIPFLTEAEARTVHAAWRAGGGRYFVSENCVFYDEIEALRRLHASGRLGNLYYAEGDYVHDCTGLWLDADGRPTWRGQGRLGVYATHAIGPLLHITGDRVTRVRCTALPGHIVHADLPVPTMHLLEMTTVCGRIFRTRIDAVSHRPHLTTTRFVVQGTGGAYESALDGAHGGNIWLADSHEPTRVDAAGAWHPLDALYGDVIPDRIGTEAVQGGHGTSEYWLFRSVLAAIRDGSPCPIEGDAGFDIGLPCVAAVSAAEPGAGAVEVPDSRAW